MPSPFPGMNPYLEHPDRWSTVHNRLMVAIADSLFQDHEAWASGQLRIVVAS